MKTVCFLNGHLILREHKTGVHFVHEMITKKLYDMDRKYEMKVALFDASGEHQKIMSREENKWISDIACVEKRFPRILSYILPIELFFGKNDMYICDGLVPHTLFKSKKVCIVHDLASKIYPENYSFIRKIYLDIYYRSLKKADIILCVSNSTKKDINRFYGIDSKKIIVMHCGVDEKKSNPPDYEMEDQNIDVSRKYFLYVGDMRKNKNLSRTVNGFIKFCKDNHCSDVYLYIAGKKSGEYEFIKEIVDSSDCSNQIEFLGYVSEKDKVQLYMNTIGVVLVSLYEGFGIPIMEGIQYSKPILTSNCSSMKEVGEGVAVLVDPYNVDEIAEGYLKIYSGNYIVDSKLLNEKLNKYNFDNVAAIVNDTIEKLL